MFARLRDNVFIMKLSELAEQTFASIETGSPDLEITSASGLDIAQPGDVTFLANPKYTPQIKETKASAIFLNEKETIERSDIAVLRTKDPYLAYTRALRLFYPESDFVAGVHSTAVIDETADIALNVAVGAYVVIGARAKIASGVRIMPNVTIYEDVEIGENTLIHSGVSIRENTVIGRNCTVYNNATIGCDGFGYARDEEKRWLKIPQVGRVVIEDDVEIGANTAIDRASVGETRIKRGAKLDNLVQIGHACVIDEDALICSQTGLAGSSVIGKRVILAGQVGVAGHLTIGDDAVCTAQTGVPNDIEPGKLMSGYPAVENREWLRSSAAIRKLGEYAKRLRELEKRVLGEDKTT